MLAPRARGAFALLALAASAALAACANDTAPKNLSPAKLTVEGSGQAGLVGASLPTPLTVTVMSSDNKPVPNVNVTFQVTSGSASVSPSSATTDARGIAQTQLHLGDAPGQVEVTATVQGTGLTQKFVATAVPSTSDPCTSASALSLTVGQVIPSIAATAACVSGGTTGASFVLVPFDASQVFSSTASVNFISQGATTAAVPAANLVPQNGTPLSSSSSISSPLFNVESTFETQLRERERRNLSPLIEGARATVLGGTSSRLRPSFSSIPANPTLGQLVSLNTNAVDDCTNPKMRTARVVAVSGKAIVVADTSNPAGGYTDADYASIATTFDTLVYDMDVQAFGAPSDVDKNGKIILFFTSAVNQLTPKNSSGSYVGGFFYARDIFPTTDNAIAQGCPSSNYAEMFYLLVPDPNGLVSIPHKLADVTRETISTTAHEFQHLINASRRMYVNTTAEDFEEVWLNEGLSHIAEELLFYHESGDLAPRQNIDGPTVRASQKRVDAFNNDMRGNGGRYRVYLAAPNSSSPYADNDSLENRGAIWSFLRYAADHNGGTGDGDVWYRLVNSTTTGMNNLQQVFGSSVMTSIRDWATSVLTDDLAGVTDPRYLQPSWNWRSVFPAWLGISYPLKTWSLSDGSPVSITLNGGGVGYVRFAVPAGAVANVQWGVPPQNVNITLVRTK